MTTKTPSKTHGIDGIAGLMKRAKKTATQISETAVEGESVSEIALDSIRPHPNQPRKTFDDVALRELADSIKVHGVLEPIVILPAKDGFHYIVAGERRWRASQLAGKKSIPVVVRDVPEEQLLIFALVENIQRERLPVLEEADSVYLVSQTLGSQKAACEMLGKDKDYVSKMCTVAQLPEYARKAFNDGVITDVESLNHVKRLQNINEEWSSSLVNMAVEKGSVTRKYTASMLKRAKEESLPPVSPTAYEKAEVEASVVKKTENTPEPAPSNSSKSNSSTTSSKSSAPSVPRRHDTDFGFYTTSPDEIIVDVAVSSMSIEKASLCMDRVSDEPGYVWLKHKDSHVKAEVSEVEFLGVRLRK